jgi:hypothetical protein
LSSLSVDDKEITDFPKLFKAKYVLAIKDAGFRKPASTKANSQNDVHYAFVGDFYIDLYRVHILDTPNHDIALSRPYSGRC